MGAWSAIATGSVRREALRDLLSEEGTSWDEALHVTATTSLAAALRGTGRVALPIATLLDLITLPGHPADRSLSLDGFPGQNVLSADTDEYRTSMRNWQSVASGRRLRIAIEMDSSLRRFVRAGVADPRHRRVLLDSRRDLSKSVVALAAAGIEPGDLRCADPLAAAAADAWSQMERDVPAMMTLRRTLYIDTDELRSQNTEFSQDVAGRIRGAFDRGFRAVPSGDRRVVVHHGFYFFTPPQWALFQLLREFEDVDQIFVIHDDGVNPAFKTWRAFFSEHEWRMPNVRLHRVDSGLTAPASVFLNAMRGQYVDPSSVGTALRVLECRNSSEFVREWRRSRISSPQGSPPLFFSAGAESVNRLVTRLDRDLETGPVDLAELPVGVFLLAVHDCIDTSSAPTPRARLSVSALLDIAGSGYLDVPQANFPEAMSALRRSTPFFKGCVDGQQWTERAVALERLVLAEVSPLGERISTNDLVRMTTAAGNPLRRAPWADLSAEEAGVVRATVVATVALIEETTAQEEVSLDEHLRALRRRLERGMRGMPESEVRLVLAKLSGFSDVPDTQIDVAGLVDVVRMLLGREADFGATGEADDREDAIRETRSLDSLGFQQVEVDMHVTNLAEGMFPGKVQSVGWPFRVSDLEWTGSEVDPIAIEIMEVRARDAAQSDLYLLWLALDAIKPGAGQLTLSWIADLGNDPRSPSSLITLLTRPSDVPPAVVALVGGVEVERVPSPSTEVSDPLPSPAPVPTTATLDSLSYAVAQIDLRAAASAHACPRRFALQWALGDSAAFRAEHHHAMLFGNVMGALVKSRRATGPAAERLCRDLWRQLTLGERQSSLFNRRVLPTGGAPEVWLLTLEGHRTASPRGVNKAYVAARENKPPDPAVLITEPDAFLPAGVRDVQVCTACPVRDKCSVAKLDEG